MAKGPVCLLDVQTLYYFLYPQSSNSFLECHYRFPRLSFEEISRYNKRGKIEKEQINECEKYFEV